MNASAAQSNSKSLGHLFRKIHLRPGFIFGTIIITALIAFEIFNFSTTDYALQDLLGDLRFAGLRWSTILAIAFCGIDFAGIARLFTPEQHTSEPKEVWYLFGAWLLAATMNAALTWWGVSMAITTHTEISTAIVSQKTLTSIVPVFVALMVWVIRILIIGSLSIASDRLFGDSSRHTFATRANARPVQRPVSSSMSTGMGSVTMAPRPAQPRANISNEPISARPEPTYHSMNARPMPKPAGSGSGEKSKPAYHL
jgi:hypothetical protein